MCQRILTNQEWHRFISEIILPNYQKKFRVIIGETYSSGLVDKDTWNYLNIKHPVTATFYAVPKVHKSIVDPPGRPIVSGLGCLTEHASQLKDDELRPFCILSSIIHVGHTGFATHSLMTY